MVVDNRDLASILSSKMLNLISIWVMVIQQNLYQQMKMLRY